MALRGEPWNSTSVNLYGTSQKGSRRNDLRIEGRYTLKSVPQGRVTWRRNPPLSTMAEYASLFRPTTCAARHSQLNRQSIGFREKDGCPDQDSGHAIEGEDAVLTERRPRISLSSIRATGDDCQARFSRP